jgi:hypothetical protein
MEARIHLPKSPYDQFIFAKSIADKLMGLDRKSIDKLIAQDWSNLFNISIGNWNANFIQYIGFHFLYNLVVKKNKLIENFDASLFNDTFDFNAEYFRIIILEKTKNDKEREVRNIVNEHFNKLNTCWENDTEYNEENKFNEIAIILFLRTKILELYVSNLEKRNNHIFTLPFSFLYSFTDVEKNQFISKTYGLPDTESLLFNLLKAISSKKIWMNELYYFNNMIDCSLTNDEIKESHIPEFIKQIRSVVYPHLTPEKNIEVIRELIEEKFPSWLKNIPYDNNPRTIEIETIVKLLIDNNLSMKDIDNIKCFAILEGKGRKVNFDTDEQSLSVLNHDSEQKKSIEKILSFKFKNIPDELGDIFKMQMLRRIKNPDLINQRLGTVCGVVVFMQFIAKNDPCSYVNMIIDLIENGQCTEPFLIKNIYTKDELNDITVDCILLYSFRNQKNILPFNISLPDNLRDLSGATLSYEIVDWINYLLSKKIENNHLYSIQDTCVYLDADTAQPLSALRERLFLLYSPNRIKFDTLKENLFNAIDCFNQNKQLLMLIHNDVLLHGYVKNNDSLLGIEYTHYVSIHHIALHKDEVKNKDIIEISGSSEGTSFQLIFDLDTFLTAYRGAIIIDANLKLASPTKQLTTLGLFAPAAENNKNDNEFGTWLKRTFNF